MIIVSFGSNCFVTFVVLSIPINVDSRFVENQSRIRDVIVKHEAQHLFDFSVVKTSFK